MAGLDLASSVSTPERSTSGPKASTPARRQNSWNGPRRPITTWSRTISASSRISCAGWCTPAAASPSFPRYYRRRCTGAQARRRLSLEWSGRPGAAATTQVENVAPDRQGVPSSASAWATRSWVWRSGGKTFKLKFGHRGANHPVLNELTNKVEITSHNHGFAVDPDSLKHERGRAYARQPERPDARRLPAPQPSGLLRPVPPRSRARSARFALSVRRFHETHEGLSTGTH